MSRIIEDIKYFWSKKVFGVGIPLMMLLSYGTLLLNPTVGIDDTSFKLYYVDGVSPAMGRWCLYLINKLFPLKYNPFFVEAMGLLFFCLSITLWCIVFYRMFGKQLSALSYTIFCGVMLSCPMISEVVIWYLQDGIYLGYGACALAVLFGMAVFVLWDGEDRKVCRRQWAKNLLLSILFLTVALGFYESFMIVFLIAMVLIFLLVRVLDRKDYSRSVCVWIRDVFFIGLGSLVLRTVIVNAMIVLGHLEEEKTVLRSRGIQEVLGWFDGTKTLEDFIYVLKDFFVKYYLNAPVYLPVLLLVAAIGILGLWAIRYTVKKKDGWILAACAAVVLIPWVMPVLEGVATYYRSSQYVPLLTAFAVLMIAWELRDRKGKFLKGAAVFLAFWVLYNQSYEMNKWLHVDAMKYEDTKRTMSAIALKIQEECDSGKPVCVVGEYETPAGLLEDAYCPSWSKKYWIVSKLVKAVDEDVFDKYDHPQGYVAVETPLYSTITWGQSAFFQTDRELIAFWKMHGFSLTEDSNQNHYREAYELMKDEPGWPAEGSIVEMEDHIIVNLGCK